MKAAIFDLDGTLMDTEIIWVDGTRKYLRQRGCRISREAVLAIVYGRSWRQVYADIISRFPSLGITIEVMEVELSAVMQQMQDELGDKLIIRESVSLLRRLAGEIPVCIVSGSPCADIERAVRRMGIADELAFFIGADQYGPGKPDPTCFLMARERLGVAAADCVVFEDSAAGVRAAKAAGMHCVALARPGMPPQDVSPADLVVADLGDVDLEALRLQSRRNSNGKSSKDGD